MTASPNAHRCCPHVHRDRDQVDPATRGTVNDVIRGRKPWPLTILGPVGCGKSCLALCLADYFQDRRSTDACYLVADELGRMLADARCGRLEYPGGGKRPERLLFDDLTRYGLVIVDELGQREHPPASEYDAIKRILDTRVRPTVLISNADLPALSLVYDDRLVSRLCPGTVIGMAGPDRRLTQAGSRGRQHAQPAGVVG